MTGVSQGLIGGFSPAIKSGLENAGSAHAVRGEFEVRESARNDPGDPKGAMKQRCVFSFCKNENIFLPLWLKYYSRHFNEQDIYIINHDSDDGSIEKCLSRYKFNVINIHRGVYDAVWKTETVKQMQTEFLRSYEIVLFADADEMIVPNPAKHPNLASYILQFQRDFVRCTGYQLFHEKKEEAPIDLEKPIIQQRKYWYRDAMYDKALLSRIPLNWLPGFHEIQGAESASRDPDLWLLHAHKFDYDLCWEKHMKIASMRWDEKTAAKKNVSWQFRFRDEKTFAKEFYYSNSYKNKLRKPGITSTALIVIFFIRWVLSKILNERQTKTCRAFLAMRISLLSKIPAALKTKNIF